MKLRLSCILLMITFVLAANADNLGYSAEKPLIFGIDQDYPPLEYLDEKGTPNGKDVELAKTMMNRLHIPMMYRPNKWAAVATDVLSGKSDLAMMVFSPYRKDSVHYSRAVVRLYYQMLTRKDERKNYGLRDVGGQEIALMKSRPVVDTLKKSGAKIAITYDLNRTIKELSAGKYDAVICYRYQAKYYMNENHITNLNAEDLTLTPREYCFVSQNKQLIDAINKELDKMEKEGEIDNIYANVIATLDGFVIPQWLKYVVSLSVLVLLVGVIIVQRLVQRKLKKTLERAQESEERAKQNEEIAKNNETKANEALEAAHKSEELKNIFLGNMSHSLRTPLNAIIGFSDLLMTMDDETMPRVERDNLLQLINKNGLDLLHMVNELLSLSDIEGKTQLFQREVTDVDYEMGQYAAEIRQQLHEGVTLEVEEPMEGIRALLDRKLLRGVTMHLLDNAMQHTTEGRITLRYYVKEGGLYCEVKDTGCGLPEKLKDNIFGLLNDRNTYTHDESQENPGLGLSVCKAIMDRSNGKIGVKDNTEDGRGTIFWYWTPTEILN